MIANILRRSVVALVATGALLWSIPALAADQDFTLHNKTGREMKSLYVSPSEKDSWGPDILGQDTLADGADLQIKFDRDESECKWDVRAEFADGSSGEVRDVDFCTVTDVTFHP